MSKVIPEELSRPLLRTTRSFYLFTGILLVIIVSFLYAWWLQITIGLGVTGLGNAAVWGLYITNFMFLIGVASAGMLIGAVVHLGKAEKYRPLARMSELITCISLVLLLLFIIYDMGRPDRVFNLFIFGNLVSPFMWDLILVTTYLLLSIIALYLPLRGEMAALAEEIPKRRWLYKLLAIGYRSEEAKLLHRTSVWLAAGIVLVMVSVHAAAVPWLFGLMSGRPGWYSHFFAAYWALKTITTGLATVILVAAIVRKQFGLEKYIGSEVLCDLSRYLAILTLMFLHFVVSEHVTYRYIGPPAELEISNALLFGEFAWLYWPMITLGLIVPALILITPKTRTVKGVVIASTLLVTSFWVNSMTMLVPSLTHPLLPYDVEAYVPTRVEWLIMGGTYALGILTFAIFTKLFPIIELKAVKGIET